MDSPGRTFRCNLFHTVSLMSLWLKPGLKFRELKILSCFLWRTWTSLNLRRGEEEVLKLISWLFFFFFFLFLFFFFFYLGAIDPYFCKEKKTITEEWAPYVTQTFKSQTTYWTDLRPHTGLISDHILDWSQNYSTMMKARCPSLLRSCRVFWASCSRFRFWFNWSVWLWRDEMRTAAEVSTCCMNPASSTSRQRLRSPNSFLTTHFRTSDSFWLDRQTHCHLLLLQQLWQNQMVNWFKFTI